MKLPVPTTLYAAAAVLAATGVVTAWVLPPHIRTPTVVPVEPPVAQGALDGSERAVALLEYEQIARFNPFSQDRTPPATRYVPPERRAVAPAESNPTPPPRRFTLYGVASGQSGAVALIDADPAVPGAEIYRPGDRVGDYRLETVDETFVVLRRSGDSLVLRLQLPRRMFR